MQIKVHRETADRWAAALETAAVAAAGGPDWLARLRHGAASAFRSGGLPHRKVEAWKYAPLAVLDELEACARAEGGEPAAEVPSLFVEVDNTVNLLDGQPIGSLPAMPAGVRLLPLALAWDEFEDRLRPLYERVAVEGAGRAFAALNTACAGGGLLLHVPAGVDAGQLALGWAFSGSGSVMHHPRVVILLESGARLSLLEQMLSAGDPQAGLNLLLQIELGEGARMDHLRMQMEGEQAVLLTDTEVSQAGGSRYRYWGFDLGGRLARHEIGVRLQGEDAKADLAGALVLDGRRYADHHVSVEHLAPGCRSRQFFRGVLGGRSRGVFNGKALIHPGADGSSVRQSNANLLLSPLAEMDTKPELEIYADEVEASHGATVGQLDEQAVFYLRSRGLSDTAARHMLTAAFCRAVTDCIDDRALAGRIGELLDAAMPVEEKL